jgi:hypothetical protein
METIPNGAVIDVARALILINGATFVAILVFGYKVVRFFNNIEFKTDLMWTDYRARVDSANDNSGRFHSRIGDHS